MATASKEKVNPSDGTVDRYVAGEHMDTDDLKIHRWGDPNETDLGPAFHRRFRPGQVLYGSRRTYLRKVAVADFDGVCANTTFVVQTKDPAQLLPEFLPFVMSAEPFHAFAIAESKGSVNPYVNWSDIERYEFNLPPLDEQKRISDLLWAVELHHRSLTSFHAALLAGMRLFLRERFESVAGGAVRIVDLTSEVVGGVWGLPEGESEVDVLALGPRVYAGGATRLSATGSPTRSISRKQAERRAIQTGDIVLERSGGSPEQPVGRVVIADEDLPACIPTDFQRLIRPDRKAVEPLYLFWKLRSDWLDGATRDYSKRTTNIANLSVPAYLERSLRVPSRAEQLRLVGDADALERTLADISTELASVARLRAGLLTAFFGGN
ncbi:restriction endonuclease subunit S [Microbacterium esteraromaticum]|uniref:restriction endonuclease subunit S n=1 Tax=Microbacterium esteraromaticum TaxID=57043 RepID=UPI001C962704|nr:restriction endonuclease subunit S [Microbacterium esteraromaticum]MBY6061769.1 restriction endonuclease subunit S [Microbacterium esteraromaticum]